MLKKPSREIEKIKWSYFQIDCRRIQVQSELKRLKCKYFEDNYWNKLFLLQFMDPYVDKYFLEFPDSYLDTVQP